MLARHYRHLTVSLVTAISACSAVGENSQRVDPVYDASGRLQLLRYDADGDGTADTWSYMDGARIGRVEIDTNDDGRIDRWEYYTADQQIDRVELSTKHDGRANRTEHFERGVLRRGEEDTDGDGRVDKWETYEDGRLASVAFDTRQAGMPDRRVSYDGRGNARLEVAPDGDGRFVPAPPVR